MESVKDKQKTIFESLKEAFGYGNVMAAPKLLKIMVSTGVGKARDKKRNELIIDRLARITGQKPAARAAKKSVAAFKLREGETVGFVCTLRGSRMFAFLDKLINVAIPRTRDFQGLKRSSVDEMGNLSIGIPESTIFPETGEEDLKDVFGMAVTLTTTAKNKAEAIAFFETIGIPFEKES
jgi:large subunit ribosomal protein L5